MASSKQIPSEEQKFCGVDMGTVSVSPYAAAHGKDDKKWNDGPFDYRRVHYVPCDQAPNKTLVGRKFSELQSELPSCLYNVTEDLDGYPVIHLPSGKVCSPTQEFTDALCSLKKSNVSDCCVGIPAYFTYQQRKEVLAAARMAGLIPHGLLHETTATALMYRLFELYLTDHDEVFNMAFIDVGETSMQISVFELKGEQLKVLSYAHDESLGGRSFDEVIFQHVLAKLEIDTSKVSPSSIRKLKTYGVKDTLSDLPDECCNLKNELSVKTEAELRWATKRVVLKRAEFEKLSCALLIKVKELLQKALNSAGVEVENFHSVHVVGFGSKVPALLSVIRDFFGKEPKLTMLKKLSVAVGCFIRCGMICFPTRFPTFQIIDILPYSIVLTWDNENETSGRSIVFPKGRPFPSVKNVTLRCKGGVLTLSLFSSNDDDSYSLSEISTYKTYSFGANNLVEVLVIVRLDLNGMAYVESATVDGRDALGDKVQKAEKELADDVSTQLENSLIVETRKRLEVEEELQKEKRKFEEIKTERESLSKALNNALKQIEELRQMKAGNLSSCSVNFTEFTTSEIKEATNKFAKSLIGAGGFGSVYKGFLRHTTVAIKILNPESYQGDIEAAFNQEVEILTKVRHPNLILLIGACREARALVYEFLPNGSLEDYLNNEKDSHRKLSWEDRIRIASEICSALIFLHSIGKHGIAHGDLKPENILLDSSFRSKIIDFGISRELNLTEKTKTPLHLTQFPKYTPAYADPLFLSSSNLTPQSDTYSFGIILLQLVTSRSPRMITEIVEDVIESGEMDDLVDVSACRWPMEIARELALLGIRCCGPRRRSRPDLAKEVWSTIESLKPVAGQSIGGHLSRASTK